MIDRTFIDALASKAPTPGGGGAAAYVGALASALASMVANLTVGKKSFAAVEDRMIESLSELANVRDRLIDLIDEDARAFEPLSRCYAMPTATVEQARCKEEAMQKALVGACEIPLAIMRACAQVIELSDFIAYNGSRLVLSDVGAAVSFAKAALESASLNVLINVKSMTDSALSQRYRDEVAELTEAYAGRADDLFAYVVEEIG